MVDEAIRPVAKATVVLTGKQAITRTDAGGVFIFTGLQPGTYFLAVNATHYVSTQTSVDVKAGEATSARIQVQGSNDPVPYHTTLKFKGNMALYLSFASFVAELLVPNTALCQCTFNVTPDPAARTFVYEAIGEPATHNPAPVYGTIYWEFIGKDPQDIRSAHGDFPVYEVFQRDSFANETQEWTIRITGSQWVHYNTEYTVFLTTWYHADAPKDWSFVKGDV
ncbi:MAG TPA: carboxypeptidase-like regulatory domain-containing protein [Candidatus Thermoplasmatota archaeon]|nr:carboxypeptidase-like regulatory domain-containing protein [Candidatus Thermoplasmatota archaeon]